MNDDVMNRVQELAGKNIGYTPEEMKIMSEAFGYVGVMKPQLALAIQERLTAKLSAKALLENMRRAGIDLNTPNGVVLEGLLISGTVDPVTALTVYNKLQESQLAVLEAQKMSLDILYKQALLNNIQAQTALTQQRMLFERTKFGSDLIKQYFEERLENLKQEEEELQSLLTGGGVSGRLVRQINPEEAKKIEARLDAIRVARRWMSDWKRIALVQYEKLVNLGYMPAHAVSVALQESHGVLAKDIYEKAKEGTLNMGRMEDIRFGREVAEELEQILGVHISPDFARQFIYGLKLSSGGTISSKVLEEGEKASSDEQERGMGLLALLPVVGMGFGVGYTIRKLTQKFRGKAKSIEAKQQKVINESREVQRLIEQLEKRKAQKSALYREFLRIRQTYGNPNPFLGLGGTDINRSKEFGTRKTRSGRIESVYTKSGKPRWTTRTPPSVDRWMTGEGGASGRSVRVRGIGMMSVLMTLWDALMMFMEDEERRRRQISEGIEEGWIG